MILNKDILNILKFIEFAEGLKRELRHSYLSDGRVESVAEHSWRLSLMVMAISDKIDQEFDLLKAMKMAVIHDIGEIVTSDIPLFNTEGNEKMIREKFEQELKAIDQIGEIIDRKIGEEIKQLWLEMEKKENIEAKVVHALDKLEAQIQHNQADLSTWTEWEKERVYSLKLEEVSSFNNAIKDLCDLVVKNGKEKIEKAD